MKEKIKKLIDLKSIITISLTIAMIFSLGKELFQMNYSLQLHQQYLLFTLLVKMIARWCNDYTWTFGRIKKHFEYIRIS